MRSYKYSDKMGGSKPGDGKMGDGKMGGNTNKDKGK